MLNFNVGLEAELFLKNKNGEIISPHLSLPIDGSGNLIEIRADCAKTWEKSVENFYRKFESVKELCYPNIFWLSKEEKLSKEIIAKKAYSYKGNLWVKDVTRNIIVLLDSKEADNIEIKQTSGLHIHIDASFLGECVNINPFIESLCKEFDVELFKILPFDKSRKLTQYRTKQYTKEIQGFEYRSLYFDELTLKNLPEITQKVFEILNNSKEIKNKILIKFIGNLEDFEKINQDILLEYIENLYKN